MPPATSNRPPSTVAKASNAARTPRRSPSAGRNGAAAHASAGSAGRMYMSRLPGLALKNSSTSSIHASGHHTRASRWRQASRHGLISQGMKIEKGSQNSAMTSRKYHGGAWWCQAAT